MDNVFITAKIGNIPESNTKYVGDFYGVEVFESDMIAPGAALALPGVGIFIGEGKWGSRKSRDVSTLYHELGHIIQAEVYGLAYYYTIIAPTSLVSSRIDSDNHTSRFFEREASTFGYEIAGRPNWWYTEGFPINK